MSGLTFTRATMADGDFTLNNLEAKKFAIVHGYFDYAEASASALTVTTAMTGLISLEGFIACPKDECIWQYTPSDNTVQPIKYVYHSATGTDFCTLLPSASTLATATSVPFLAWGWKS